MGLLGTAIAVPVCFLANKAIRFFEKLGFTFDRVGEEFEFAGGWFDARTLITLKTVAQGSMKMFFTDVILYGIIFAALVIPIAIIFIVS